MNLQRAFEVLAREYGSHKDAAVAIGYTPEHYRGLRNGRFPIPLRVERALIEKAQELSPTPTSDTPPEVKA